MRILHTADWHLGDRLGRIDRTHDLRKAVERVAVHCREHKVDVLLVAGDLFSELARPDSLRETIRHWQEVFRPFLQEGGTILTLTGNHDNESFCQTLVHAMNLAAPTVGRTGETIPPGRLYLAAEPTFVRLQDCQGGFDVQFVLMPYPTPSRYLKGETSLKYGSPEEKIQLLNSAWAQALREIRDHSSYDLKAPAVLGAHVHLYGSSVGSGLFRITSEEDVVVEATNLANQFDYVALGHIHKPQYVDKKHVCYSGSIERLDLGEQNDRKRVVMVDISADGRHEDPVELEMPSTPIYEVSIADPAIDIPRLKADYPSPTTDLVNLHIRYTAGKDQLEEILRELDRIFPRWYARDWEETGALGLPIGTNEGVSKGFADTVRDYLSLELIQYEDSERAAIMNIANELLREFENP